MLSRIFFDVLPYAVLIGMPIGAFVGIRLAGKHERRRRERRHAHS